MPFINHVLAPLIIGQVAVWRSCLIRAGFLCVKAFSVGLAVTFLHEVDFL